MAQPASVALFESPRAEERLAQAATWLSSGMERALVIAPSLEAAGELARRALASSPRPAAFGWERTTLGLFAVTLARPVLVARGLAPAGPLALEAVAARIVHANRSKLGRYAPIGAFPGLPRALARTLTELRLAGVKPSADPDLARLAAAYDDELAGAGLADRADVHAAAAEVLRAGAPLDVQRVLLADLVLRWPTERALVAALVARVSSVFVSVLPGDARTRELLLEALPSPPVVVAPSGLPIAPSALERLQAGLFGESTAQPEPASGDESVRILSAPGESRECVEIARLVLAEARQKTPFDRIAILLRTASYVPHVLEALRRAGVPAHVARGVRRPDPTGRAFLALLACKAEGLSARRFAEYLSLGEMPDVDDAGRPPPPRPRGERFAVSDEESHAAVLGARAATLEEARLVDEPDPCDAPPKDAPRATRAPRHWEQLLASAAVIGTKDRWARRLDGLLAKLGEDEEAYRRKAEDALADASARDRETLRSLRAFALPLVDELAALPDEAPWGTWLDALSKLATRALGAPDRVLAVLGELEPMAKVGPVELREVRLVLEARLCQITTPPASRRFGKVFVGSLDEARGLAFDVVFVPGLAEKMFPQKVSEDPLLLDRAREATSPDLPTNRARAEQERLALRLAAGAARRRVVFSYPRLDVEQARPRTPSFYGLEILRIRDGELRGFEDLIQEASEGSHARIGWPAPDVRDDAIDEAEFDLALLSSVLDEDAAGEAAREGAAHYLVTANPHLARALRFRWARWDPKAWRTADGFVAPAPEALAALADHALASRSFSPTALQNYAACPYRFFLSAIHKLAPREEPEPIEALDPLTRGSLVHEVQFATLTRLHAEGLLPVTPARLEHARTVLSEELARVAGEEHDTLCPAIERVWSDAIEGIGRDLREWLRLMTTESAWTPAHFELSFGLKDRRAQDEKSQDAPVVLDQGIRLRGSIDLVERCDDGSLRATDHKTGKVRAKRNETIIGGGETLQPVLYALVIEKMFPGTRIVGGRLYYCTSAGNFERVDIALDDEARTSAAQVAKTIGGALTEGFLPAAPSKDACRYCDYRPICGPYEEMRTKKKQPKRLTTLQDLRRRR